MLSMYEMQASWYEFDQGRCLRGLEKYGRALKKLTAIQKHYDDIEEDQFDFHVYCLRKMTLRAYVSMLRWEDTLRGHEAFRRATEEIVSIYLELHHRTEKGLPIVPEDEKEAEPQETQEEQTRIEKPGGKEKVPWDEGGWGCRGNNET